MTRGQIGDAAEHAQRRASRQKRLDLKKIAIRWGPLLTLIVLCVIISILNQRFLSVRNFQAIAKQGGMLLIMALGVSFVIMMCCIDLSIEGLMAMSSVIVGFLVLNSRTGLNLGLLGVLGAVLVSTFMGFINGWIHARGRIPSFMVTLGMWSIGLGLATWLYGGYAARILDPNVPAAAQGRIGGVPNLAIIATVVFLIALFIERYTRLGRYIFAIGGGEDLAKLSGVPVEKYKILVFTLAGCFFGIGGVLNAARIGAGSALVGDYLFPAITSVVVGGTALTGGLGGVVQTLVGTLIVIVISNGMVLLGVNDFIQLTVHGCIITVAVILTLDRATIPIIK
jgi:ribose transport system permease protein